MTTQNDREQDRDRQALRENEQRLRAILETSVEGIITIDEDGVVESLNPAACEIFGYGPEEVVGRNISMLMPSPDRDRHDNYIANYRRTGHAKIIGIGREVTGLRKDGSHFPMDLSVAEVRLGNRRIFTGFVRDITERKQAETALRESIERLRAIFETAVEGIFTIDERGIVESMNPAASRIFGYTPDEIIGKNVSMLMPKPDRDRHDRYISNYLETGQAKVIGIGREVIGLRKDGTQFPLDLSVSEVQLDGRRIFTGLIRDITERRQLEQAVASAAENERTRIARELHDGLGQQLGGLLFMMNGLKRDLEAAGSPQNETAAYLCTELTAALNQARTLSHELYPVSASPDGLLHALDSLAERVVSERKTDCSFIGDQSILVHNQATASHLYRIAQEAVHNALKHARAKHIEITLGRDAHQIVLSITDDGAGFPAQAVSSGLGLRSMNQRARLMNGQLTAQNRESGGAEIQCAVPDSMLGIPDTPANS